MTNIQNCSSESTRRKFLVETSSAVTAVATGLTLASVSYAETKASYTRQPNDSKMKYCLNTSTIQGEKIPIWEQVEIAKRAGYDGIEIWLRDVDKFEKEGESEAT